MGKSTPRPTQLASPPAVLGQPARWLEELGSGAGGRVWLVELDGGTRVAVKVAATGQEERLAGEAEALLAASAPSIVRVLGGGRLEAGPPGAPTTAEPSAYLALDWVDGVPLSRAWDGPCDRQTLAAALLRDIGEALLDLHASGRSHGDVKPENILVRVDEARPSMVLIDLGLASAVDDRRLLGATPRYLPPDALSDAGSSGRARDVFALGLAMAEVLAPELRSATDVAAAVQRTRLPEPFETRVRPLLAQRAADRPSARWLLETWTARSGVQELSASELSQRAIRRTYLEARRREIVRAALSRDVRVASGGRARRWLKEALQLAQAARAIRRSAPISEPAVLADLDDYERRRWLVSLVGPTAASWPLGSGSDTELIERLTELASSGSLEGITRSDLDLRGEAGRATADAPVPEAEDGVGLALRLRELPVDSRVLRRIEESPRGRPALELAAARALRLRGELSRARLLLSESQEPAANLERALIALRAGEPERVQAELEAFSFECASSEERSRHAALVARRTLDAGDAAGAQRVLDEAPATSSSLETRALVELAQGDRRRARATLDEAKALAVDDEQLARLHGVFGMLEHAESRTTGALAAFERAVEHAERAGAVLEEATYLTGLAATATNRGLVERALRAAERSTLLFEHLGRSREAARAALARAAAYAIVGAEHELRRVSDDALRRAREAGDVECRAFVHLALCDGLRSSSRERREHAERAFQLLSDGSPEHRVRVGTRLLASGLDVDFGELDHAARTASAREVSLEWWGARARARVEGRGGGETPGELVDALVNAASEPQVGVVLGPALAHGAQLALTLGRVEDARRMLAGAAEVARSLLSGVPAEFRGHIEALDWVALAHTRGESQLSPEQLSEVEGLVRSLGQRERLRPLLEQVLDALLLWTGVERGLLLLRAPGDKLVVRAARNLGRKDLTGEQLSLSQSLAKRALAEGEPVVAVDAARDLPDVHRSVHALKLRSVLAVPLIARGETQGVVYLDDRVRQGAFGSAERAWVKLVATLAAVAIADARDQLRLRRAAGDHCARADGSGA